MGSEFSRGKDYIKQFQKERWWNTSSDERTEARR